MAGKDLSPEKRLLNIIEGGQGGKVSAVQEGRKHFSPGIWKARFSFLTNRLKQKPAAKPGKKISLSLKSINSFFQAGIVIAAVFLGISIRSEALNLRQKTERINLNTAEVEAAADPALVVSLLKPESQYLEMAKQRNLFSLSKIEQPQAVFTEAEVKETTLQTKIKDFKLVGISWAKDPDAIIENITTKKTYFVKTGSMVDDIKIEAIHRDKVIMHYQSEEIELR